MDDSWRLQVGKGKAQRGIVKYDLPNNNNCRGIFGELRGDDEVSFVN